MFLLISLPSLLSDLPMLLMYISVANNDLDFSFFIFLEQLSKVFLIIFSLFSPYLLLKYRASRTSWKGISARLTGSAFKYAVLLIMSILSIFSLNILAPYFDVKRKIYVWNNMYFGNVKFTSDAESSSLMGINIITTLLMIPTLGISRLWYYAALDRKIYSSLELSGIRMKSVVTGEKLAKLGITNLLLVVFTLGIALPFIVQRNIQFYIANHVFKGDLNILDLTPNEDLPNINKDYSFYLAKASFGTFGSLGAF